MFIRIKNINFLVCIFITSGCSFVSQDERILVREIFDEIVQTQKTGDPYEYIKYVHYIGNHRELIDKCLNDLECKEEFINDMKVEYFETYEITKIKKEGNKKFRVNFTGVDTRGWVWDGQYIILFIDEMWKIKGVYEKPRKT